MVGNKSQRRGGEDDIAKWKNPSWQGKKPRLIGLRLIFLQARKIPKMDVMNVPMLLVEIMAWLQKTGLFL